MRWWLTAAFALLVTTIACGQSAQSGYPARPIRVIVPFAPGGSTDVIARVVSQKLAQSLGQPVVIENRPGAASNVGTEAAARAPADGYTLLMGTPGLTINPALHTAPGFHPVRDFAPVALLASVPLMIVTHPALPVRSVADLVALARSKPDTLGYASNGSSTHLAAELFQQRAGIRLVHVPYKGSALATNDLLAGHLQIGVDNIVSALPHVRLGTLRALAVTSVARASSAPQVPTLAESGFPGFDASSWFGLLAPAGTPRGVVALLNEHALKALEASDVRDKLSGFGAEVVGGTPERFAEFVAAELDRWTRLVRERGITPG